MAIAESVRSLYKPREIGRYALRHPHLALNDARVVALQEAEEKFVVPGLVEKTKVDVERSGIKHVAIITDKNRTWAKRRGLSTREGHERGAQQFVRTLRAARGSGIKIISGWGASPDNINERPEDQMQEVFDVIGSTKDVVAPELLDTGGRLVVYGDRDRIPPPLMHSLEEVEKLTETNREYQANLLLDYNLGNEQVALVDGVIHRILTEDPAKRINPDEFLGWKMKEKRRFVNEIIEESRGSGWTSVVEDIDVVIRTGVPRNQGVYMSNMSMYALNADAFGVADPLPLLRTVTALNLVRKAAHSPRRQRKGGA